MIQGIIKSGTATPSSYAAYTVNDSNGAKMELNSTLKKGDGEEDEEGEGERSNGGREGKEGGTERERKRGREKEFLREIEVYIYIFI